MGVTFLLLLLYLEASHRLQSKEENYTRVWLIGGHLRVCSLHHYHKSIHMLLPPNSYPPVLLLPGPWPSALGPAPGVLARTSKPGSWERAHVSVNSYPVNTPPISTLKIFSQDVLVPGGASWPGPSALWVPNTFFSCTRAPPVSLGWHLTLATALEAMREGEGWSCGR